MHLYAYRLARQPNALDRRHRATEFQAFDRDAVIGTPDHPLPPDDRNVMWITSCKYKVEIGEN